MGDKVTVNTSLKTTERAVSNQTVALHTLGCRLNQYETEAIREQFVSFGFRVVSFTDHADVYVINTCTVTNQADARARQFIRKAIRRNQEAIIVATGCYAQTLPQELLDIKGINIVLGNVEKGDLVGHVLKYKKGDGPISKVTRRAEITQFDHRLDVMSFENRTRAILKIQDGCDQFCSFCIIPWARGKHRSLSSEAVVAQAKHLTKSGYSEIVLTGVHLGDYGVDLNSSHSLTSIIKTLLEETTVTRLRLSSIWPTAVDGKLLNLFEKYSPRLCRYLHLAIQHADDGLLKLMGRTYTSDEVKIIIEQIISIVPDICIGADIMVGFPGETETKFNNLYNWLDELPFAYFHVFTYSKRNHTRAARMDEQIPSDVAKARSHLLRELSDIKSKVFNQRFNGRVLPVLIEEGSTGKSLIGTTDHGLKIKFDGPTEEINTFVDLELISTDENGGLGRVNTLS